VGRPFEGMDTVIIGDTPRDVGCARAFGARAIAVATGWHSVDDLAVHRPDHVFVDFSDWERALEAILAR
jgi:phosphoglycolate phosphatase